MRHQQKNRKFGRKKGQRKAFFKSLISNLILKGKIETTDTRAKSLRSKAEHLVTLAKKQNLASLRILISKISKKPALKLYHDIAPKYADRKGGYTRIIKLGKKRLGDASKISRIEFI
jgi:large subunit ribosomal protein L17